MTASIGIAFTGQGSLAPEELLRDADLAMYRTKRGRASGRDVLDLRELHLAGYQASLARALPGAQQRGEMHLEYQPIIAARDGRITDVEALLRWTHPARGAVSPTVFIPFAEQSGQIIELGQWVLERAWSDRHRWEVQGADAVALSVNVSAHQFMSAGFAEMVAGVLAGAATDPGLLTLEVTESVFVRDEDRALIVLDELKDVGVRLALDDFGTGYSSLGYLNRLPIDAIKVDHTFISELSDDPESQRIVSAIIGLGHSLGMTVVCEGVETAAQHRELAKLGSDCCQGFYFAKPMVAARLPAFIRNQEHNPALTLPIPEPGFAA
jgi:EAL domain-containing protein (putative c-di-GMP-specific phosphodiesterase class I)